MTKVPQGFDFSFLNEEEARQILQVLERNEELQRAEKYRISKLQRTKRDIRWLQGVTGEWFEEIQRKKFCNETDVSQMLKPPLTYRLRKEMAKNDPMELQASRSKAPANHKLSVPSRMSFRSSFASLFSFRKSGKETLKPQSQRQKGSDGHVGLPMSVRRTTMAKIYNSPVENQPVDSVFVPKPTIMREESGMPPPWDASLLENEFFQVLDDLDSQLSQEQSTSSLSSRMPFDYASRTQFHHSYSRENRHGNTLRRHKDHHHETSNMSIYDILRPGTPREGFKTFSPRTRAIYDMYRTREPRVLKEDFMPNNTFGSTSLCFDSRQRSASPAMGHFTARSLHFPATSQSKSSFIPASHQQSPKRTPLSSIIWNSSDSTGDRQTQDSFLKTPPPMDIDPADQYMYTCPFQESRRYELYHSSNAYQSVPMDKATSPDTLEDSENMPFYHQDKPRSRSFFSNPFRRCREQRFGPSSLWSQQEGHTSWSDFHQGRKPFASFDKDFEMISVEANNIPLAHGLGSPLQHWGPSSPTYGTYIFRGQEEPHRRQSDFQVSSLENMEIAHANLNQSPPHLDTSNVFSMADSSCHTQSSGLEYQQDSSPTEVHINKEPHSLGIAQTLTPSFKTSFPLIPDDKGTSQRPNFQDPKDTLQKVIPNKPDFLPIRSCTGVTVASSDFAQSQSLTETQLNIPGTEMNNEKDINESVSESKQPCLDQTNKTGGTPKPVSQIMVTNPSPNFQQSLSQDSAHLDRLCDNISDTVSSRRSPRVFPRKGGSQTFILQRDKDTEPKTDERVPGNGKVGSATLPSFPSPNQSLHQESTSSHKDHSSIINHNQQCSEPTENQKLQSPQEPAVSDSSPADHSFLNALVPSTTVFFRRSPTGKDPSLEEGEGKDSVSKSQNKYPLPPSVSQKSSDSPLPVHDEGADVVKGYSPFRNAKGKGRVRHRISCIEKLSKMESQSTPMSEDRSILQEDQSDANTTGLSTVYCTLPRKSSSFLIKIRQPESKIMTASIRNGPLPFQIKNSVEDTARNSISNKGNPSSPETMSEYSQVASDLATETPEATKRMTSMKAIRSASVRKGPLPFLVTRAMSCPSGLPCTSMERNRSKRSLVSNIDASTMTPGPWERTINPLESDSAVKDYLLTKRHHQKECSQEGTEKDRETSASKTSLFSPSSKDGPFCTDMSGKESRKALHKFKTTSMFSVSGDKDNVKCLEVVSVYYTLPRKPSKQFCNLLQQYAQNMDSLTESLQMETKTSPNALEGNELHCSTQEQSGIPLSEELKMQVDSAHTTENKANLQLPDKGSFEPILEEMASVGTDDSLQKGKPKTRENFPDNISKTPLDKRRKLHSSLTLQEKNVTEEKSENCQQFVKGENKGLSVLSDHSEDDVENSQTSSSGEHAGGVSITSTESERCLQEDHAAVVVGDSSSGSHPRGVKGTTETDCPKLTDNMLSDSESQAFGLTQALHKLQLVEEDPSDEADLQSLWSEPRESPQGSCEVDATAIRKIEDEVQELACNQTLLSGRNDENKTNLDEFEQRENRYSIKYRVTAMSKANSKFPAKDISPRRHVATIFPQSESKCGFGKLSLGRLECNPLFPEPTPKSRKSKDESSLSNDGLVMEKSEIPLQVTVISNKEPLSQSFHHKSNNISQVHQNEVKNVSGSPPKHESSKDVTVTQILEELRTPAQFSNLREKNFSDHQWSPLFILEPTQKSVENLSLPSCQSQHGSAPSPGWEPEPQLYRSKSLKSINVHDDLLRTSHPPKARGRHFSETTSIDNAFSPLPFGNDCSDSNGNSRRFSSFSELPSSDENWPLYSNRTKTAPKSTSSISRPIDYGIFGKEQQLAFLENVKRSLTQGRLWKPSFLKNPGFLKDELLNPSMSQPELLKSNSPRSQVPEDVFPSEPLNIYEEDRGHSDCDTDTTTDDEYYLDENDKESEL
uniref:exophilin-5 isoform X2 n=1 Tax=Jaculus jaculus TaxID=51337 RepID=UPI001E1B5059|nr:exophilin-5 isoform X2 [Jaculus jaculus]